MSPSAFTKRLRWTAFSFTLYSTQIPKSKSWKVHLGRAQQCFICVTIRTRWRSSGCYWLVIIQMIGYKSLFQHVNCRKCRASVSKRNVHQTLRCSNNLAIHRNSCIKADKQIFHGSMNRSFFWEATSKFQKDPLLATKWMVLITLSETHVACIRHTCMLLTYGLSFNS